MKISPLHYRLAGVCLCLFLLTQVFQELTYDFWVVEPSTALQDLTVRLLALDQARALAVMGGIVLLMVVYAVVALDHARRAPVAALLGFTFATLFVAVELLHRGFDFFAISRQWAPELAGAATAVQRDTVLARMDAWNRWIPGLFFPLMLSALLASTCFAIATMSGLGRWNRLAPVAFGLNALRLLARLLSTFAGVTWLAPFNDKAYFPAVLTINTLLAIWLFWKGARPRARVQERPRVALRSTNPSEANRWPARSR